MTAATQRMSLDDFIECLEELDDELETAGYAGTMKIHAVGGFAMLAHGLRTPAVTGDIDTASCDFTQTERDAIDRVADTYGIDEDWLNNHTVLAMDGTVTQDDVEAFDAQVDASYEPFPKTSHLRHIEVSIASLPTLAKSKAYAVCSIESGARSMRDLDDLLDVFGAEGLRTTQERLHAHPWLAEPEFAECASRIGIAGMSPKSMYTSIDSYANLYGIEDIDNIDNPIDYEFY